MSELTYIEQRRVTAFLGMIAAAEGTNYPNGYRYLYGSHPGGEKLFSSFADHPRVKSWEMHDEFIRNGKPDYTTAAGKFQVTETTYDRLMRKWPRRWRGFGPRVQDDMACELIREIGAWRDVLAGDWQEATRKCSRVWASLPGGPVGSPQRARSWAFCGEAYQAAYLAANGGQPPDLGTAA